MAIDYKAMRELLQKGLSQDSLRDTYQSDMMEWIRRMGARERETAYEVRRKEEEFKRRYLDREPLNVDYDWAIVPMTTAANIGTWGVPAIDDNQYESSVPGPRDELEERCRAKGLDPNFARELDLD